jgi:glyoxylase-like metal-dependent hydrolase (beta-lactamase superfamily II)
MAEHYETPTQEQRAAVEAIVPPTLVYEHGIDLYLGSRLIQVRSFPGHAGGDSVVFVPDAHVVFTGDLFWRHSLPNTVDASTRPWLGTLTALLQAHPNDVFVPGMATSAALTM